MKEKKPLDPVSAGRALTGFGLRVLVSGYLVYLAWGILSSALKGESTISLWVSWLIFAFFVGAAIAFCVFAWKQYRQLKKAAELPPETDSEKETDDPE
jgi:TRAP-type C4-dicarboxylate transport system permease small subunit